MDEQCELDEDLLLDYVIGEADAAVQAAVEGSPPCKAEAERLAQELSNIKHLLKRRSCPDPDTLLAYQEHNLPSTEALVIRRHIADCPLCQAEHDILVRMDAVPLMAELGLGERVRRLVYAVFRPALEMKMLGDTLYYEAPQISITLSTQKRQGKLRTWMLLGETRTNTGLQASDLIETVMLRNLDESTQAEYQAVVDEDGSFVIEDVPLGTYSLSVLTADEEVKIRQVNIGDDL